MPRLDMERAVGELSDAIASQGGEPVVPPTVAPDVRELAAAIAPFLLPEELMQFWEQVDLPRVWETVEIYPDYLTPEHALEQYTWCTSWDDEYEHPARLLPIAYGSLAFVCIELDAPGSRGGALFEYSIEGGSINSADATIAGRLRRFAEALNAAPGWFRRLPNQPPRLCLDDDQADDYARWTFFHLADAGSDRETSWPRRRGEWPARWD